MKPPIECWDISAETRPLEGGNRNIAVRTFGLDQDLVFKTTQRSVDALLWLDDVHNCAEVTGFVVPKYIRSNAGAVVEQGWTCEPFIEGVKFERSDLASIDARIRVFHRLAKGIQQRPGFASSIALISQESGGDVDFSTMPSEVVAACREAWRDMEAGDQHVIHGDLNGDNLIWDAAGRPALLDWDEARVDCAVFDLAQVSRAVNEQGIDRALVAWEVACSWKIEPEYARGLLGKLGME